MMKISDNTTSVAELQFTLECKANFTAMRTKDFPKLLEDVQKAAANLSTDDEILYASAGHIDNQSAKAFTITLIVKASSWYSAGVRFDELNAKILADAQIVEHRVGDSALQRYMKSQNDRFVTAAGRGIKDVSKAA